MNNNASEEIKLNYSGGGWEVYDKEYYDLEKIHGDHYIRADKYQQAVEALRETYDDLAKVYCELAELGHSSLIVETFQNTYTTLKELGEIE